MKPTNILLYLFVTFSILMQVSCKEQDQVKQTCTCLKKAANTFMVKGEKATEEDLWRFCSQFEGKLKEAPIEEKRHLSSCIDTVKTRIDKKRLFTEVEKTSLPAINGSKELSKEITRLKKQHKKDLKAIIYALKGRTIKGKIGLHGVTQKSHLGVNAPDTPDNYKVVDGNLIVSGYLIGQDKPIDKMIRLYIPEKEKNGLLEAKLTGSPLEVEGFEFRQIIEFEAEINSIVTDGIGRIQPMLNILEYDIYPYE